MSANAEILITNAQFRTFFAYFLMTSHLSNCKRQRLETASPAHLRRFCMPKHDFSDWLWDNRLSCCDEPFKWYIKAFNYVAYEMKNEITAIGVDVDEKGLHNYSKLEMWEVCALDNETPFGGDGYDEIYFVRHEDMDNEIYWEAELNSSEDEELALQIREENQVKEFKETGTVVPIARDEPDTPNETDDGVSLVEGEDYEEIKDEPLFVEDDTECCPCGDCDEKSEINTEHLKSLAKQINELKTQLRDAFEDIKNSL